MESRMPKYVEGVELTQEGMHAIFARMGHAITSGKVYNGVPEIDKGALDRQGFMPVLTGVGPNRTSGHWIMLMKGGDNQYYLFDPLGKASGDSYKSILAKQVPGATLSVIPNAPGLNMGLCGYWVASAGLRAHAALNTVAPPDLATLGETITTEMTQELTDPGYGQITGWLGAVGEGFPVGDPKPDAKALREATEKELHVAVPEPVSLGKTTGPTEVTVQPTAPKTTLPPWNGFSLYTDQTVRDAIKYSNTNYLGTQYTGPVESRPAIIAGKTVYRQVHGLAHTLRTMAYSEVIIEEARKAKLRGEPLAKFKDGRTIADVTPAELKKIMIAQAFFVAGRDDEESALNYARYHEQSRDAFLKYVKENESTLIPDVFKDQAEVDYYAKVIEDKNHDWESSPAHVLVNKGHMVDLMRVKQPPESFLENYFASLKPWVGSKGAEAVFAIQRQFFHATHEAVSGFDGAPYVSGPKKDDHLVLSGTGQFRFVRGADGEALRHPIKLGEKQGALKFFPATYKLQAGEKFEFTNGSLGRYVIGEDGQPIRNAPGKGETVGSLAFFAQSYELQGTERWMRVDEFLQQEEVQKRFPGAGKVLEGGKPGLNTMQYDAYLNSRERADCETNVDYCLGKLQDAHHQAKIDPVKAAVQSSTHTTRREANVDELAAANILKEIMANPDAIQADHVLINGQRLDEKFFRGLLAKCDMAIVGSLLNDTDIKNIDNLMKHEESTEFHTTGGEPVSREMIGKKWLGYRADRENGRRTPEHSVKMALIHMMQDGAWYYTRLNAVAQGRDSGSSFREVLLTALMVPSTFKSLADVQSLEYDRRLERPKTIHKGLMNLPPALTQKILAQSEAIIANTTTQLFSETGPKAYQQMKINHFSHILSRTCSSTSSHSDSASFFTNGADNENNIRLDIEDPEGLLDAKRVGAHGLGAENEYSVYLPDDVALVPMQVSQGNPNVIRLMAVKSPDFIPRHESGYAVTPFIEMQKAKIAEVLSAVAVESSKTSESSDYNVETNATTLLDEMKTQLLQKRRTGYIERLLHYFNPDKDSKISVARATFLETQVVVALDECNRVFMNPVADREQQANLMRKALAALPNDAAWAQFVSTEAIETKARIDVFKQEYHKKTQEYQKETIELNVTSVLNDCTKALDKQNFAEAAQALNKLPTEKEMEGANVGQELRGQIVELRQKLSANLESLQRAVPAPVVVDAEKMRLRYEALVTEITKKVTDFEKVNPVNIESASKAMSDLTAMQEELKFLRNEKIRMHTDKDKAVEFADIEALEIRVQETHPKLLATTLDVVTKGIDAFAQVSKKMPLAEIKQLLSSHEKGIELIRKERIKAHGDSTEALDQSDLDALKVRIQTSKSDYINLVLLTARDSLATRKNPATLEVNAPKVKGFLDLVADLELTETQRADLVTYRAALGEKQQKAYPVMLQLQYNSEILMMQLRSIAEIHIDNVAQARQGLRQQLTITETALDGFFRTVTTSLSQKEDQLEKVYTAFKASLNNDKSSVYQLMELLRGNNPVQLQAGLGLSKENAEQLHGLLIELKKDNVTIEEFEAKGKLITEFLTKVVDQPVSLESVSKAKNKEYYDALLKNVTSKITAFEKVKPDDPVNYAKAVADLTSMQGALKFLKDEKTRMHIDKETAVEFSDIEALEGRLQGTQPKLINALVEKAAVDISKLEKMKITTFPDIARATTVLNQHLKMLEFISQERVKLHGDSVDPLEISDVNALKARLQTVNQSMVELLLNVANDQIVAIKDRATFAQVTPTIQACFEHIDKLKVTLDTSIKAQSQIKAIPEQQESFGVIKTKAESGFLDLQIKKRDLIVQLRGVCDLHTENLAGLKVLRDVENGGLWAITNALGISTDSRAEVRMKEIAIAKLKLDLNNPEFSSEKIIAILAGKSVADLKDGLGISEENATSLRALARQLGAPKKIEENLVLIGRVSAAIGTEPVPLVVPDEVEDDRYTY